MPKDLDHQLWRGQRPWFEIWFAVLLDEGRRRALWLRESLFIPKEGDGRATIWGAWFDADAPAKTRSGKRILALDRTRDCFLREVVGRIAAARHAVTDQPHTPASAFDRGE